VSTFPGDVPPSGPADRPGATRGRNANLRIGDREALEAEVLRLVDAADARGLIVRVLGSLAVSLHCPDARALIPSFERTYADIDLAAYRRQGREVAQLLVEHGYVEDREVSLSSEGRRGLFDAPGGIHVDVFYDQLDFCHVIPLAGRLETDRPTLPLAELLLSKLQIVRLNEKDAVDVVLLLLDHELASGDADTIDVGVVARACAADWGLWRTLTGNLEKVVALASTYGQLSAGQRSRIERQVQAVRRAVDEAPKGLSWKARARVGDRVKWWTDVDEVR